MRAQRRFEQVRGVFLDGRRGGIDARRQHALGQVVPFLKAVAAGAHQIALHVQPLERAFCRLPVPPALVASLRRFEVARQQRPFGADAVEHGGHQLGVVLFEPMPLARAERVHSRQRKAIVAHRQVCSGVKPVFECAALANEAVKVRGSVVRYSIPQRMVVCAGDYRDRIDLHIAQLFERAMYGVDASPKRLRTGKALRIERDAAQQIPARNRRGHPSESPSFFDCRELHV